jgi:hypothetical protein
VRVFSGSSGRDLYPEVVRAVARDGRLVDGRGGATHELEDVVIHLDSPLDALPLGVGRGLNPRIAVAEVLQLTGGFSDPAWLCRIAPQFTRFREDIVQDTSQLPGELRLEAVPWFHGAYGNRIAAHGQLDVVIERLRAAPTTRQAIITLWDPALDTEPDHLDYPCTVAIGFLLRENVLSARVTMRSNDAWLGLPYDLFQFTQLQLTLCNVLGAAPGTYTHTAWSLHLYAEHLPSITALREPPAEPARPGRAAGLRRARGIGRPGDTLTKIRGTARAIAYDQAAPTLLLTPSEETYLHVLYPERRAATGSTGDPAELGGRPVSDGRGAGDEEPLRS